MSRLGWFDASSGASGDMVLGALLGAGVPRTVLEEAIAAVTPEPVRLEVTEVTRNGFAGTRCAVLVEDSDTARDWAAIRDLLAGADLSEQVRDLALTVFARLAEAEAEVHGVDVEDVHFHEVGALDSIADITAAAAGFVHLGLDRIGCSPVALGGGTVRIGHGVVGVPAPAVAVLLRGLPSHGGPIDRELTTPTGAAILAVLVDGFGPQPPMSVEAIGVGAGAADPDGHANVLRLLVGTGAEEPRTPGTALLLETNVDDLDPRLWPEVIAALLAAGAGDAWLSPILMKKGRPAHTLHVLVAADAAEQVRTAIFRHTSTIGLRESVVGKRALDRHFVPVTVDGHRINVKIARLDGVVMNVQPEYDDVAAAARALERPAKDVLAQATALARELAP